MIADLKLGSSFEGALSFGAGRTKVGKVSELVVTHNLVSTDVAGMAGEMEAVCRYSSHIRKGVLHISISFHPEESPSQPLMLEAMYAYLQEMHIRIEDHQIVVYEHHDTAHKHLHVYVNRVSMVTGKAPDNSFSHLRSEAACRVVEKRLNMRETISLQDSRRLRRKLATEGDSELISRQVIRDKNVHREFVRNFVRDSIGEILSYENIDFDSFTEKLKEFGIEILWRENELGEMIGASFRYNNRIVTGTMVGYPISVLLRFIRK